MDYSRIYVTLCERGKNRDRNDDVYLEKHHIIPTFFFKNTKRKLRYSDGIYDGDGEHKENITYLTAREHFLAHILLCKIWSNTKWYYRCASSLMLFYNKIGSTHIRANNFNPRDSKKYDKFAIESRNAISKIRSKTMPVKNSITGIMIGSVSTNHPKVLSGEWVHHSKGKKASDKTRKKMSQSFSGLSNSNSKYTDQEIIDSYLECCTKYDMIVNQSFWIKDSIKSNKPYLKIIKEFRFDGNKFKFLIDIAKKHGLKLPSNAERPFHSKEYKDFLRRN